MEYFEYVAELTKSDPLAQSELQTAAVKLDQLSKMEDLLTSHVTTVNQRIELLQAIINDLENNTQADVIKATNEKGILENVIKQIMQLQDISIDY